MSPVNWDSALPKERSSVYVAPIQANVGKHQARMIGFTETWDSNERCFDCGNVVNPECTKCKGKGIIPTTFIGIKYKFRDEHIEQEKVTFKISPPNTFKTKDGKTITTRPSTFYNRLVEFTQHNGNDPADQERAWGPGQLAAWAKEHAESADVPVEVRITSNGKYAKIEHVFYREVSAPTEAEVVAHRQPPRDLADIQQRARENAAEDRRHSALPYGDGSSFDDREIPF